MSTAEKRSPHRSGFSDGLVVRRGKPNGAQVELFGADFGVGRAALVAAVSAHARGGAGGASARTSSEKSLRGETARPIPEDADWREAARNRLARLSRPDPSGCILWRGSLRENGYGYIGIKGLTYSAHRVAYVMAKGQLAPALQVDHTCFRKECINPDHLEAVTLQENVRRAWIKARMRSGPAQQGVLRADRDGFASKAAIPTNRQRIALKAISDFMERHGWAPTTREICELTGIRSTNGVMDHLKALHRRGLITRGAGARTLALTDAGRRALAC